MSIKSPERTDDLIRTSIQLSREHRENVEQSARNRDRSMSYIIREALDEYFDNRGDHSRNREPAGARS